MINHLMHNLKALILSVVGWVTAAPRSGMEMFWQWLMARSAILTVTLLVFAPVFYS